MLMKSRRAFLSTLGATLSYPAISNTRGSTADSGYYPTIIGHRGAAGHKPDNTLLGIETAAEYGVDGVEIDIRRTADDKLILFHDPLIKMDSPSISPVEEVTLDRIRDGHAEDKYIPTLSEALQLINYHELDVYLDLKSSGITDSVIKSTEKQGVKDDAHLLTFNLDNFSNSQTTVPKGYLTTFPSVSDCQNAHNRGCDMIASYMVPEFQKKFIRTGNLLNLRTGLWTLYDTKTKLEAAYNAQPDMLIVNRLDIMDEIVEK